VADGHHSHDGVIQALEGTLKRLGTDYLDLYLLHAPDRDVHIRETMRAMNTLVKQGIVKHIGVSNFSVEQFKMAQEYSEEKIVANQLHYNLQVRELERSERFIIRKTMFSYCMAPYKKNIVLSEVKISL
jgi:aryl-alcohol dehydrogenase-like predicted oxidoreductase